MRVLALLFMLLVLVGTRPGLAATDEQVTLSPAVVEKFLASHAELEALAVDLAKKYGDRSESEGDDPVLALLAYQDIAEAKQRTIALLVKFGFIDIDDWQRVTNSVFIAYQFLDPANVPPDSMSKPSVTATPVVVPTIVTTESGMISQPSSWWPRQGMATR